MVVEYQSQYHGVRAPLSFPFSLGFAVPKSGSGSAPPILQEKLRLFLLNPLQSSAAASSSFSSKLSFLFPWRTRTEMSRWFRFVVLSGTQKTLRRKGTMGVVGVASGACFLVQLQPNFFFAQTIFSFSFERTQRCTMQLYYEDHDIYGPPDTCQLLYYLYISNTEKYITHKQGRSTVSFCIKGSLPATLN